MIIDAHLHLRDDVYVGEEGTPENIIRMMDEVGIAKAVLLRLYVPARKAIEELEKARNDYPERFIPFAYALPDFCEPTLGLLKEAITYKNFKGLKFHAGICPLEDYLIDPALELADELEVPCLIDPAGDFQNMKRIATKYPNLKVIIAHLGQYMCQDSELIDRFIRLAKEHDQLFLDISGVILEEKIKIAIEEVGVTKVIWGTDGPSNKPDPVSFTCTELEKVTKLEITMEEKSAILGGNIARLLGIGNASL